jgi:hypothetical protein
MAADYKRLLARFIHSGPDGDGEYRAWCPLCEDPSASKTPSASFNFELGYWSCFKATKCGGGGSLRRLVAALRKTREATPAQEPADEEGAAPLKPLPTEDEIRTWHERALKHPKFHAYLNDERGLTDETVKRFLVGHDGYRFTIPIYDENGELVNVRRYDPKRKDQNKMISWAKGYGSARIYGIEMVGAEDELLFVEGEWDRLVAIQEGLPAACVTAGAQTFLREWAPLFRGKRVWFCYDDDSAGLKGARRAAGIIAPVADEARVMQLDTGIKGGDVTDFFIKQSRSVSEFREIMEVAEYVGRATERIRESPAERGLPVSLEDSFATSYGDKPLELIVSVSGKRNPPYLVPRRIRGRCDQAKGGICAECPMGAFSGEMTYDLRPDDVGIVEYTEVNTKARFALNREKLGARCSDHLEITEEEVYSVEELYATNSVEVRDSSRTLTPIHRRILHVSGYSTPVNTSVRLVGRQTPDPKTQRGVIMAWQADPMQTSLDRFEMTPSLYQSLSVFRHRRGQTPLERAEEIAADLEANITNIYGRRDMHIAFDLVWHSILDFPFLGGRVGKGWLELLVVGDTRTGKSELATRLADHYNAGVVKSCEGATFAGIVGGAQQVQGAWLTTWGLLPLNDRRLVVLDEASGLRDKDIIENMSSIRSSGRAQMVKITQEEASARVRLIWISNPPDGRTIAEIPGGGMEVVKQLIPNPEDIARYDLALCAASTDVDWRVINSKTHDRVEHEITADLANALVTWCWTRTPDHVYWMPGVEEYALEVAERLGREYIEDPPLIQIANSRMKVAKLAVALAARTFSTDRSGQMVVVKKSHVTSIEQFINRLYGAEAFGYLRHSRRALAARKRAQDHMKAVRDYLAAEPDVLHTLLMCVTSSVFRMRDFEEGGAMDRVSAQVAVRKLMEWRMITRGSKGYLRPTPALIGVLKSFEDEEDTA